MFFEKHLTLAQNIDHLFQEKGTIRIAGIVNTSQNEMFR
jgi:hypothetical protein